MALSVPVSMGSNAQEIGDDRGLISFKTDWLEGCLRPSSAHPTAPGCLFSTLEIGHRATLDAAAFITRVFDSVRCLMAVSDNLIHRPTPV